MLLLLLLVMGVMITSPRLLHLHQCLVPTAPAPHAACAAGVAPAPQMEEQPGAEAAAQEEQEGGEGPAPAPPAPSPPSCHLVLAACLAACLLEECSHACRRWIPRDVGTCE